ncbi:MAG: rhamnulose-1-phosphate aldolase [Bacteroidales bacterium]|nr:rhamnulose-1-phosphate aldolase [Bacteroidales bacterium]MCF8457775.1 rhamnulose-1-phosphate aldolase [Bacteroidales bacterium]
MKNKINQNRGLKKTIIQVAEVAGYLWQKGWAERNAGNISVNIDQLIDGELDDVNKYPVFELPETYPQLANKYFFVTGTGKRMRDLARAPQKNAIILKITKDAKSYHIISRHKLDEPDLRPTSELPTHLAIHQQIAERGGSEKVIIHTHVNELVALTHSPDMKSKNRVNNIIWGMHPEAMVFIPRGVGFVPYVMPGSVEIANLTLIEFQNHDVVLWEKHGVFAIGESVFDTFDSIDIVSKSAKIWFTCMQAGFEPEGLSESQLQELKAKFASGF